MLITTLFRITLLAYSIAAAVVVIEVLVLGPRDLPDAAMSYLVWISQQPQSTFEVIAGWSSLIAVSISIAAALSMAAYVRVARPAFAIAIMTLVVTEIFLDFPVLKTQIEQVADSIVGVFAGGIIVFSYWSSISVNFGKQAR